jgi:predicted nucleotidyltransferase
MNTDHRSAIDSITAQLIEKYQPEKIILFGSAARGDATPGSDLDLLVVHDSTVSDRQVRRQLERLFLPRRFALDLIVRTQEEVLMNLADNNPFYSRHIFGQGKVLYERPAANAPH